MADGTPQIKDLLLESTKVEQLKKSKKLILKNFLNN